MTDIEEKKGIAVDTRLVQLAGKAVV